MNKDEALEKMLPFFPTAHVNKNDEDELIVEPKNNIYFRIDNVFTNAGFDCKIIAWCSRSACKGLSNYWQRYMRRGLNSYFNRNWSVDDWMRIYTRYGNDIRRNECAKFLVNLDITFIDLMMEKEKK
jgi:hypothetical protein